jgi:hypothetical protein
MKTKINQFRAAFIGAILMMLLSGCNGKAQQVQTTTNPEFNLELLFEKDGCKIYRFVDGGRPVYWTDCRGKIESVYSQQMGKTTNEVRVQNETIGK